MHPFRKHQSMNCSLASNKNSSKPIECTYQSNPNTSSNTTPSNLCTHHLNSNTTFFPKFLTLPRSVTEFHFHIQAKHSYWHLPICYNTRGRVLRMISCCTWIHWLSTRSIHQISTQQLVLSQCKSGNIDHCCRGREFCANYYPPWGGQGGSLGGQYCNESSVRKGHNR